MGKIDNGSGMGKVRLNTTSTRFTWKVGDSGSTSAEPVIEPAPVLVTEGEKAADAILDDARKPLQ